MTEIEQGLEQRELSVLVNDAAENERRGMAERQIKVDGDKKRGRDAEEKKTEKAVAVSAAFHRRRCPR
jgi:hypothetical protein